jgi:hypothetical protein
MAPFNGFQYVGCGTFLRPVTSYGHPSHAMEALYHLELVDLKSCILDVNFYILKTVNTSGRARGLAGCSGSLSSAIHTLARE